MNSAGPMRSAATVLLLWTVQEIRVMLLDPGESLELIYIQIELY